MIFVLRLPLKVKEIYDCLYNSNYIRIGFQKKIKLRLTWGACCNIIAERRAEIAYAQRVYGVLAQLGEHLPYKQRVIGSSPIGPIFYGIISLYKKGKCHPLPFHGEVAQLARAHGSYPWCQEFKSPPRYFFFN